MRVGRGVKRSLGESEQKKSQEGSSNGSTRTLQICICRYKVEVHLEMSIASDIEQPTEEEGDEPTLSRHAERLQVRRSSPPAFTTSLLTKCDHNVLTASALQPIPEPAVRIGELDLEGFRRKGHPDHQRVLPTTSPTIILFFPWTTLPRNCNTRGLSWSCCVCRCAGARLGPSLAT